MTEVKNAIEKAAKGEGGDIVKEKVEDALQLTSELKAKLEKSLESPEEKAKLAESDFLKTKASESIDQLEQVEHVLKQDPGLAELPGNTVQEKVEQLVKEYQAFTALKADPSNAGQNKWWRR